MSPRPSHCGPGPQVWEWSYKREFILPGDESAGMVHQCALNRNKLLVDRAPQLIKSFVKKDEVALEDASSVAACSTPTHRGEKNESFSLAARALGKGGKAAGYTSRRMFLMSMLTLPACQKTPQGRALAFMGDRLQEMRNRKRKAVVAAEGPVFPALTNPLVFEEFVPHLLLKPCF